MTEITAPLRSATIPTRPYKFDDLRLQVDQRLQIDAKELPPGEQLYVRLLGYRKGATLIIKLPAMPGGGVAIKDGDEVVVRGFTGRLAFSFVSLVEKIRFVPYTYCHLRFPEEILGAEIRKAMRAHVNIPARVLKPGQGGDNGMEAIISDISPDGAMLSGANNIGVAGDTLTISFRFWIPPNDYEVNLTTDGIIQVVTPLQQEEVITGFRYGIKFKGMRSTEAILLQTLVYHHLLENK